jgi:hypothetical protein
LLPPSGAATSSPNERKAEGIKKAADAAEIRVDSVMNMDHWKYPLSSSDAAAVEKSLAGMRTSLHNAKLWGSDAVLLVPAVVNPQTSYREAWSRSQAQIRKLLPLARCFGITRADRERFRVTRITWIGHFSHNEQFHLGGKVERTSELQWVDRPSADPVAKISEIRPAHGERRASQHAGAIFPEKHPLQDGRDINGRRVQGEELRRFSGSLNPVDVPFGTLFEERHDPDAGFVDAPPQLLQFRLQKFVLSPFHDLSDAHLQGNQARRDRVRHEIGFTHANLAAFPKIGAFVDRTEESIDFIDDGGGQSDAGCIACDRKKALASSGVIKPLDRRTQPVLRDADPDLPGGGLLQRVGLIENDEVIWKEISTLPFLLLDRRAKEHEEQSVINDNHIRRKETFARLLEETIRVLAARLARADVRFTANLRPDLRIRFHCKVAERTVLCRARPIHKPAQLGRFRGGEELPGLLQRALEPARAKIILPPFHERSFKLDRENLLEDGDVLVNELFLEIDRVRRDHRFLFASDRKKNCRQDCTGSQN